ncbi:hypothetical protein [Serratia marcescens]|uniref:hypothetical protein n=1 Tax=Serratia marcescens TaxID=615 RepID=UPI003A8743ED
MFSYDYVSGMHPITHLFADDAGRLVFSMLDTDLQTLLLATFLNDACLQLNDCTTIWQYTCDYVDALPAIPAVLQAPLALQALWRDDRVMLDRLAGENLPASVSGWMALCRGDLAGAMEAYRQCAAEYRKATRKRKLYLAPMPAMMAALTLITREEPAHAATLKELAHHGADHGFGAGWRVLQDLLRERGGRVSSSLTPIRGVPLVGMPGVFLALTLFWRDTVPDDDRLRKNLTTFHDQLVSRGYRLPAYEIATLIHLRYGAPAPALITDRRPLSLLWQRKASWEYALDALSQLTPQTTDNACRLAWLLTREHHGLALAPLEQKRNKQGLSKGRPVRSSGSANPRIRCPGCCRRTARRRVISIIRLPTLFMAITEAIPLMPRLPFLCWPDIRRCTGMMHPVSLISCLWWAVS